MPEPNPTRIWLQDDEDAKATGDRLWCVDKVWPECAEQNEPIEYIRADLYAALQAELAKAREVLEPFSVMSGVYEGHEDKDPVLAVISKGERINVTVGDFRRAREVYRALQHKEREE